MMLSLLCFFATTLGLATIGHHPSFAGQAYRPEGRAPVRWWSAGKQRPARAAGAEIESPTVVSLSGPSLAAVAAVPEGEITDPAAKLAAIMGILRAVPTGG
jgi:hypothetical protein